MNTAARLEDTQSHDHLCLIYETPEEQSAAFVPFLRAGLVQNEKCLYIVRESDPDWVVAQMRANDFPIDDYASRGAFKVLRTDEAYLRDGCFDIDQIMSYWQKEVNDATSSWKNASASAKRYIRYPTTVAGSTAFTAA